MNRQPKGQKYTFLEDEVSYQVPSTPLHKSEPSPKEWIPTWLRKRRLLPLAACCIIFAACLEALDVEVRRNHGLLADTMHTNNVNAAKYVPTVGIVLLGFACSGVTSDVKRIQPWSAMSGKWSKSSRSVALDYISNLEVLSIFSSARRKHWAVFTGLSVGFICGALVAVANSLTYVDLFASSSSEALFRKASVIKLDGTLEDAGAQNLTIPYTSQGQQPYAAVAAEQLPNGQPAPWTKDSYVFESFTNTSALPENATLEAVVKSLYPSFKCQRINFEGGDGSYGQPSFKADMSKYPELNCHQDVQMVWNNGYDMNEKVIGWLNVTACDKDEKDLRLISHLGLRTNVTKPGDNETHFDTKLVSVMCSPSFTIRNALVRSNISTGEVIQYTFTSPASQNADTHTTINALYIYLNNPLDGRTQTAFAIDDINFVYNKVPKANITDVVRASNYYLEGLNMDPFNARLTNDEASFTIGSYLESRYQYAAAVERLGTSIMAQVINLQGRKEFSQSLDGNLWVVGPRILIRNESLRVLQAFLVIIAIACVLQLTVIRPKTVLKEDPSSIASTAIVLAASSNNVRRAFSREALSSESQTQHTLASRVWRLQSGRNGSVMIEVAKEGSQEKINAVPSTPTHHHSGFHPIPLRAWAKWAIILVIATIMVTLALLLWQSRINHGLYNDSRTTSNVFAFVPTIILILLGYSCSGIDGSVRVLAPYNALWTGTTRKKQLLLFSIRDSPSIWVPYRAIRNGLGFAVAASSFAILVMPAIQIVVAGLYTVELVQKAHSIQPLVDMSIVDNLRDTFKLPIDPSDTAGLVGKDLKIDLQANVQTASQFTEWTMNPAFKIPVRAGILENLVFSKLTELNDIAVENATLANGEITLNVPAIAVDVTCKSADMVASASYGNCSDGQPYFTYAFNCLSAACNSTMNTTTDYTMNYLSAHSAASCQNASNRFIGSTFQRYDYGYQLLLGDFENIRGYIANSSFFNESSQQIIKPGMLNASLPTIRVAVCYNNLTRVTVDTTFSRKPSADSNSNATLPSWNPVRFAASTLVRQDPYSDLPYWMAPLSKTSAWGHYNQYDQSSDTPGLLDSPTLWPTRGSSTSFFELLATYATHELNNLTAILDTPTFIKAAETVYTRYTTNILTQMRPFALNASTTGPTPLPGSITYAQARISQDWASTVALEVGLGIMLVCFIWVAIRFPNEAVLPKNPGSVAATASLVAGSGLVERLRRERAESVHHTKIWEEEKAALGWWPVNKEMAEMDGRSVRREVAGIERMELDGAERVELDGSGEESEDEGMGERRGMRWGIDVGEGVIRESWRNPPVEMPA